jgi:hypothetical protein
MTLFRLSCMASIFLSIIPILISSTKRTNFVSWIFKGKSFIYNKNKTGPQNWSLSNCVFHLPMQRIIFLLVFSLSVLTISTYCNPWVRLDSIHAFIVPLIPLYSNMASNTSWFITYAFVRSKNKPKTYVCPWIPGCFQ